MVCSYLFYQEPLLSWDYVMDKADPVSVEVGSLHCSLSRRSLPPRRKTEMGAPLFDSLPALKRRANRLATASRLAPFRWHRNREVTDNEFTQVESTIIQPKGEEITVVYKLRQVNGQWKVYDAIVEDISIVNKIVRSPMELSPAPLTKQLVKRLRGKVG